MIDQLQPYNPNLNIEQFQQLLNQHPNKGDVKQNRMANNAEYLPINVIERTLDELYIGLWQTTGFATQVVANEIVGSIELRVFHPVAKEWLTRIGAASVLIQTAKDQPVTIENKIKNTLTKDYPHLKAECIKNAAKSLGVVFGRNLNRGKEDEFMYLSETVQTLTDNTQHAYNLLATAKISDAARKSTEGKISRATATTLVQIVEFLEKHQ
jgi:hypothetical protein